MQDEMARRRRWRADFMLRLYELAGGGVSEYLPAYDITDPMGIDRNEARKILEYLEEKGWVRVDDYRAGTLRLTADGIDRVETSGLGA